MWILINEYGNACEYGEMNMEINVDRNVNVDKGMWI